jgi:hypothetical protein
MALELLILTAGGVAGFFVGRWWSEVGRGRHDARRGGGSGRTTGSDGERGGRWAVSRVGSEPPTQFPNWRHDPVGVRLCAHRPQRTQPMSGYRSSECTPSPDRVGTRHLASPGAWRGRRNWRK